MKLWTVVESYAQHDDPSEVSAFAEIAKTREEADELLKKMVYIRIKENILYYDYSDEEADEIYGKILDSGDCGSWYKWVGDNETFAWNIEWSEIED